MQISVVLGTDYSGESLSLDHGFILGDFRQVVPVKYSGGFGEPFVSVKKEAEYFEGHEPQLIYIAKKLKDALRLEEILTAADIDFGVETDEYQGGFVFRTMRTGAFFYVLEEFREAAVNAMLANGFVPAK